MRPLPGTKNHYPQRLPQHQKQASRHARPKPPVPQKPASQPKLTTTEQQKSEANVGATKVKKIRKPRKTKTSETGKPK